MYRQFNIQQFYVLPTQCIYVFCVDFKTHRLCGQNVELLNVRLAVQIVTTGPVTDQYKLQCTVNVPPIPSPVPSLLINTFHEIPLQSIYSLIHSQVTSTRRSTTRQPSPGQVTFHVPCH
jgi:hypothetical protein